LLVHCAGWGWRAPGPDDAGRGVGHKRCACRPTRRSTRRADSRRLSGSGGSFARPKSAGRVSRRHRRGRRTAHPCELRTGRIHAPECCGSPVDGLGRAGRGVAAVPLAPRPLVDIGVLALAAVAGRVLDPPTLERPAPARMPRGWKLQPESRRPVWEEATARPVSRHRTGRCRRRGTFSSQRRRAIVRLDRESRMRAAAGDASTRRWSVATLSRPHTRRGSGGDSCVEWDLGPYHRVQAVVFNAPLGGEPVDDPQSESTAIAAVAGVAQP